MKTLYILLISLFATTMVAQNCQNFLQNGKLGVKFPYKYDNQSKSGVFVGGKSSTINIVCQEGKDYKVNFSMSSNILKNVSISITDESGNEYYTYGTNNAGKDLTSKREFLLSLEKQKLTIKGKKNQVKISGDIDNLKLEIQKMEQDAYNASFDPKMYYEFTPAESMSLTITITMDEKTTYKGCVAMILTNKISEKSGF